MATGQHTPLRVGVIGFGLAGGTFHAPLIAATPGLSLTAVVTSNDERRRRVHHEYPAARIVATVDEGMRYTREHDLDSWLFYLTGYAAAVALHHDRWDDAAELAGQVLGRPSVAVRQPAQTAGHCLWTGARGGSVAFPRAYATRTAIAMSPPPDKLTCRHLQSGDVIGG